MSWTVPFVVFRLAPDKKITEVFECDDLQKAKYWIKFIAEPGDVLCRTPLSPKHSKKNTQPEYWCHKETSGQPTTDEQGWRTQIQQTWPDFEFPSSSQGTKT